VFKERVFKKTFQIDKALRAFALDLDLVTNELREVN
jgi:hypothetical protein